MAEPYNPYQGQTLSPYEPTWRDRLAAIMLGDDPSFDKRRSIEGLIGSSGLGNTGFSLADMTGIGGLLDAQQEAASGNYRNAAMAIMPGAAPLKKAVGKGVKAASKAIETVLPELGTRYPVNAAPVLKVDPKSGVEYLSKTLSPEAETLQKMRVAAQKEIDAGNYTPYYDVSKRFDVNPANYGSYVDTKTLKPVRPDTKEKYRAMAEDPAAMQRLDAAYERGLLQKSDAEHWYHMGQLEADFVKEYGEEKGRQLFKERFADAMAATTGGADPTSNLMMAHYGNYLKQQGLPMPSASYEFPFPVGGRYVTGNMEQFKKMLMNGAGVTPENPKRYNFSGNFLGRKGATLDEQMSGAFVPGMGMPPTVAYGSFEEALSNQAAKKYGVDPRYYQEVGWAGIKDEKTKGGFKAQPMIGIVNEAIARTSKITGLSPEEVVRRGLVRSEIPLYGTAAAGAAGAGYGLLGQPQEDQVY